MTRRLTIDDATELVVPASLRLGPHDTTGTLRLTQTPDGWTATYLGGPSPEHRYGWAAVHLRDVESEPWSRWSTRFDGQTAALTAQAALDAAIAAGAVIDEGDA